VETVSPFASTLCMKPGRGESALMPLLSGLSVLAVIRESRLGELLPLARSAGANPVFPTCLAETHLHAQSTWASALAHALEMRLKTPRRWHVDGIIHTSTI
jgi:hypothetical protein